MPIFPLVACGRSSIVINELLFDSRFSRLFSGVVFTVNRASSCFQSRAVQSGPSHVSLCDRLKPIPERTFV
jgi:hypothetical protein